MSIPRGNQESQVVMDSQKIVLFFIRSLFCFYYKKTSTSISSTLAGNGNSKFFSTVGCRMPNCPIFLASLLPPSLR